MKFRNFRQIRAANALRCREADTATLVNWLDSLDCIDLSGLNGRSRTHIRSVIRGTRREIHRRINKQGMKAVYGR